MNWIKSIFGGQSNTSVPYNLEASFRTDKGKVRKRNEDSLLWHKPRDEKELLSHGCLAIIADGMGGHEAGDVASQMAVEHIRKTYYRSVIRKKDKALINAVLKAHKEVNKYAAKMGFKGTIGSTCTAVAFDFNSLVVVQVGDSRLYRFYNGKLIQLTKDQTLAEALVANGQIKESDVPTHPQAHILTQALGAHTSLDPSCSTIQLHKDQSEYFFMCSDGVSNELSDQQIERAFASSSKVSEIDAILHGQLLESKARDNYSYICIAKRPVSENGSAQPTRIIKDQKS